MLISRIISVIFVLALADLAAGSFGSSPLVRWTAIGAALLSIAIAAVTWKRLAPLGAVCGALILAIVVALSETTNPPGTAGAAFTGTTPQTATAAVLALALVLCGVAAALSRLPLLARIGIPAIALALLVPFGLALRDGTMATAFAGPIGWLGWTAVEIALPLAALAAVFTAVRAGIRKQWIAGALAFGAGCALLALTQAGAREAGYNGMPSLTAFEGAPAAGAAIGSSAVAGAFGASPATAAPATSTGTTAPGSAPTTAGLVQSSGGGQSGMSKMFNQAQTTAVGGNAAAIQAFGGSPPPGGDDTALALKLRDEARSIPKDGYDVGAIAAKLPNDPIAVFHFVRDKVQLEVYPGALRGAAGAAMADAGNPTDRVLLLAALLQDKGVTTQFVHAKLTDAEAAQVVAAAQGAQAPATPMPAPSGAFATEVNADVAAAHQQADAVVAALQKNGAPLAAQGAAPSLDDVRSHWSLRATIGGQSVDLDPTLPSSESGQHLGAPDPGGPVPALPDSEYVTMRFVVAASATTGGALKQQNLLDTTVHSADINGLGIHLAMQPTGDPATANEYTPMLAIDQNQSKGTAFDLHGASGSALHDLRFEITTATPGHASRTYRRWLLTPAQMSTANVQLAENVGLIVSTGMPNGQYITSQMLETAAALYSYIGLTKLHAMVAPGDIPAPLRVLGYYAREAYFTRLQQQNAGGTRLVIDRPHIAMQWLQYTSLTDPDGVRQIFDIAENGDAAYGSGAPRANLELGIVETKIERDAFQSTKTGAYDLLATAAQSGTLTRFVKQAPSADGVDIGMSETVANGDVALALASPATFADAPATAWWDVDPASGNVVGRVTGGYGAALTEGAVLVNGAFYLAGLVSDARGCGAKGTCICIYLIDSFLFVATLPLGPGTAVLTSPLTTDFTASCG